MPLFIYAVNIQDTVANDIPKTSADSRMGAIRGMFSGDLPKGVVVMNDGEYEGMIHEKKLMNSHISDDTKASTLADSTPKITQEHGIRQGSKMLVEAGVKVAPYMSQSGDIIGIVTQDSILERVLNNFEVLDVEDVYTEDVVTAPITGTLGEVISLIRKNGISRVPTEKNDGLAGIVTTQDVVSVSVRTPESSGEGDRRGDIESVMDLPLTNIMTSPVETCKVSESLDDAVRTMLDKGYGGLVVSDDGDSIDGVVTKTDAVRVLTYEDEDSLPVQITNVNLMGSLNRETIEDRITNVVDKYQDLDVNYAHVRFHKEKSASRRGKQLVKCTIRLNTNRSQIAGSGEGYGSKQAFNVARDKLERNLLEVKEKNDPSGYDREVLRDMSEY